MAEHGAALQNYNMELVKSLEDLKRRRDVLQQHIDKEKEEQAVLDNEMETLSLRLNNIKDSIAKKTAARDQFNSTINEAEIAYNKILQSSHVLLKMVQKEAASLEEKYFERLNDE